MSLTLKLNLTPWPNPRDDTPYDMEYLGFGAQFRTANGGLRTQQLANKWRVRFYWHGLSLTEKNTLLTDYASLLSTSGSVTFPDGVVLSVQSIIGSWTEKVWFSPFTLTGYYDASFQVEEV